MMMMPLKAVGVAAETATALVLYAVQYALVVLAVAAVADVATQAMRAGSADYNNRSTDDDNIYNEVG